jgi:hypothetical protein
MTPEERITQIIDSGRECGPQELQPIFDELGSVATEAMIGTWHGGAFESTSDAARMLEKMRWYGKRFTDVETVEPLLCRNEGGEVYAFTKMGAARLREVSFRGRASAAMVYDTQPIIDCFRRISDDLVLGVMDVKGSPPDFYFHLSRDPAPE